MKKHFISIVLFLISFSTLSAVSIRGNSTHILDKEITFGLNDLAAVNLEDSIFTEGIELIFTLPEELLQYRDSFAVTIYSGINTDVTPDKTVYTGRKSFFGVLPAVKKMFIDIPVKEKLDISSSFGTYVLKDTIPRDAFPILIKIEPVMKGIPSSLLSKVFHLRVSKILSKNGALSLNVDTGKDKQKKYSVFIDNKPVEDPGNIPLLSAGFHQLMIRSDFFKEVTTRFAVKAGETTNLDIVLSPFNPTVQFDFPEGAKAYLDGNKLETLSGTVSSITPGEHLISVSIGDYKISKKFTVNKDKLYKISLFLDIFIKEN